jgi:branched-chain amino acid transport system permease protein
VFYRETGQFKTSYTADEAIFPIAQDRWFIFGVITIAVFVVPFLIDDYGANAVLLPFLAYALAAIGLNILTGYCGQVSLGTGGFMAVGAYSTYKLVTAYPDLNLIVIVILSGLITAAVGVLFGLPSLRIKGFYLAVATLAAQFFLVWMFNKFDWFCNNCATGQITMPTVDMFGLQITGPGADPATRYLFCLGIVAVFALLAKNIVRGRIGREWMAIRDMDIAAEIMAGSLYFGVWLSSAEPGEAFDINQSFLVLFMVIIGGLGSIMGSFLGAAFIVLMPLVLKNFMVDGLNIAVVTAKHVEITLMGVLIIFFLIVEPHGLARLWQIAKEKLRLWPFPH